MIDVTVPVWGLTMDEAVLVAWVKKVGDTVAAGDVIAEIETDKAGGDIEAPAAGVIAELLVEPETNVEPGQVIARIQEA